MRLAGRERKVSLTPGTIRDIAQKPRGGPCTTLVTLQITHLENRQHGQGQNQSPWNFNLTDGEVTVRATCMDPSGIINKESVCVNTLVTLQKFTVQGCDGGIRFLVSNMRAQCVGDPIAEPPMFQRGGRQPAIPTSGHLSTTSLPAAGQPQTIAANSFAQVSPPRMGLNPYEANQLPPQQQMAPAVPQRNSLNPYEAMSAPRTSEPPLVARSLPMGQEPAHSRESPMGTDHSDRFAPQQQPPPQNLQDHQSGGQKRPRLPDDAALQTLTEQAPWRVSAAAAAAAGPSGPHPAAAAAPLRPPEQRLAPLLPRAAPEVISEIAGLSNWSRSWCIKARVVGKSEKRSYTNDKGDGQFFKVDLQDSSGEISATFFKEAVTMFYDVIETGRVYSFSKGNIRPGNPKYDKNELCMSFDEKASIVEADEDGVPEISYQFTPLAQLSSKQIGDAVDVAVVIYGVSEPNTFTSKAGREVTKLELSVWDDSGPECSSTTEITFWGDRAKANGVFHNGCVLFARGARVGEFSNSRNLSSPSGFEIDPRSPGLAAKAQELRDRFQERQRYSPLVPKQRGGSSGGFASSQDRSLQDCKAEDIGLAMPMPPGQAYDFNGPRSVHRHNVVVTITTIHSDRPACYPSCPELVEREFAYGNNNASMNQPQSRPCQKKVVEEGQHVWRCANGHTCSAPVWRFICRGKVMDHSDTLDVNLFDAEARQLFGCTAAEYQNTWELARDSANEDDLQNLHSRATWRRYRLKLKAQKEARENEDRVKYTVAEIAPVDFISEMRRMLAQVYGALGRPPAAGTIDMATARLGA
mmetsp:Transcript_51411/g.122200  ORF Transcript_51411/g.122200 Transcript_51411/m.122200 type:complete len:807 (-) Transcript_51411:60-2480(-)